MRQWTLFHPGVFFLTFTSYALLTIVRKTPSYAQVSLISEWTPPPEHCRLGDAAAAATRPGPLFQDQQSAEAFMGILNATFLFVYAAGNVLSGMLADRLDLRLLLTLGMTLSAAVMFVFGPVLEWTGGGSQAAYLVLQTLNALCQATGWPCLVPVMANWFSRESRGYLLGLWSSSSSVGSILGALILSEVVDHGYEYAFLMTSSVLFAGSIVVFFGLVTSPREVNLPLTVDRDDCVEEDNTDSDHEEDDTTTSTSERRMLLGKTFLKKKGVPHTLHYTSDGVCTDEACPNFGHDTCTMTDLQPSTKQAGTAQSSNEMTFTSSASTHGSAQTASTDVVTREAAVPLELDLDPDRRLEHRPQAAPTEQHGQGTGQEHPKAISFCQALLLPNVISYSLCFCFLKLVLYVFYFWLPFYLSSSYGWSESTADRLALWYDVGGIAGAIVSAFLMSRLDKTALVIVPMMVLSIPLLYVYGVVKLGGDIPVNAALLFCLGSLLSGLGNPLSAAVSADLSHRDAVKGSAKAMATVTGILEGSGTVGAAVGQILVPHLMAGFGRQSMFFFLMVAVLLSALFVLPVLIAEIKDLVGNCKKRV